MASVGIETALNQQLVDTLKMRVASLISQKRVLLEKLLPSEKTSVKDALQKVLADERLQPRDALALELDASLGALSLAATWNRLKRNGLSAYYNKNAHIEPTSDCRFRCRFCSFRQPPSSDSYWSFSRSQVVSLAKRYAAAGVTEIHITGGVHPQWNLADLCDLLSSIRSVASAVHIKAYSAAELHAAFRQANVSDREGLYLLRAAGLDSIPGGGAEIFSPEVREKICPEKCTGEEWLQLHRTWHELGGRSNATMLFGHIETAAQRVEHLEKLRALQDETGGFLSFIPLKFRAAGNELSYLGEISLPEVLRTYAVSSLFLDNFQHIKAYWPMLGKANLALTLAFGADDLDGTINDTTKIYSLAGADDQNPSASVDEFEALVRAAGYVPVERDSHYNPLNHSS